MLISQHWRMGCCCFQSLALTALRLPGGDETTLICHFSGNSNSSEHSANVLTLLGTTLLVAISGEAQVTNSSVTVS